LINPYQLDIWQTGILYQFIHTLALLAVGLWLERQPASLLLSRAALFFGIGITLFSGSLFLLACRDLIAVPAGVIRVLGPITPLGGLAFIIGWLLLAFAAARKGGS
jgi:uncharacterized membrane protein YgdD (TMEM256/DUF423 family)